MFNRKYIFFLASIIFLTLLRLFFISNTMLIDDEAYYAIYARHLNLGYIDHGPVIAYMIYFFTILIENSFTVRLGSVTFISILCYLLFQFGKTFYNKKIGFILCLIVCINMLFHTSAIIITPDSPLIFFLILTIIYYYKAYFNNNKYFFPAGIFLGLSMLSKVSALFPAIGIILFPIIVKEKHSYLKNKHFYFSLLIALLIFSPFIYWNIQNDMAFVRYQGSHIMAKGTLQTFIELWTGILLICGPILFYFSLLLPCKYLIQHKSISNDKIYFSIITFVPVIYFLFHSLFSRMELNWPIPIFAGGIFLTGILIGENWGKYKNWFVFQLVYSFLLIIIVTIQTFFQFLPLNNTSDITNRYYTYSAIQLDLAEYLHQNPDLKQKQIIANNFQIPSIINFYLKPELEASCLSIGYHETLYSFLQPDNQLKGNDFLFLSEGKNFPENLFPYFKNITLLQSFSSKRNETIISVFTLWLVENYSGKNI